MDMGHGLNNCKREWNHNYFFTASQPFRFETKVLGCLLNGWLVDSGPSSPFDGVGCAAEFWALTRRPPENLEKAPNEDREQPFWPRFPSHSL
jgi:hypothetical protein